MNRRTQRAIDNCDHVIDILHQVRRVLPELERRVRYPARDGYPSSSMQGPGQRGAISRPTELTAMARPMPDPVMDSVRGIVRLLESMTRDATAIEGCRITAMAAGSPYPPCRHCGRECKTKPRDGLCGACYQFERRTGQPRPVDDEEVS